MLEESNTPDSSKVQIVFSGLCALVCDDWRDGEDNVNVGSVEVLLLDTAGSKLADRLCKHSANMLFTEYYYKKEFNYIEKVDSAKNSRPTWLQGFGSHLPGQELDVFGLVALEDRDIAVKLTDSDNEVIESGVGVIKRKSMDGIIDLERVLGSNSSGLARKELKVRGVKHGIVAARFILNFGELEAVNDYHEQVVFHPENQPARQAPGVVFKENVKWLIDIDKAAGIQFDFSRFGSTEETLILKVGNPGLEVGIPHPSVAVSNICAAENVGRGEEVGRDFAAFYDLTLLENVAPAQRKMIHPLPANIGIVRPGTGYCAPARLTWE